MFFLSVVAAPLYNYYELKKSIKKSNPYLTEKNVSHIDYFSEEMQARALEIMLSGDAFNRKPNCLLCEKMSFCDGGKMVLKIATITYYDRLFNRLDQSMILTMVNSGHLDQWDIRKIVEGLSDENILYLVKNINDKEETVLPFLVALSQEPLKKIDFAIVLFLFNKINITDTINHENIRCIIAKLTRVHIQSLIMNYLSNFYQIHLLLKLISPEVLDRFPSSLLLLIIESFMGYFFDSPSYDVFHEKYESNLDSIKIHY